MFRKIQELANSQKKDVIEWRRFFHSIPELSFEEFKTTDNIQRILSEVGIGNIHVGVADKKTGVIVDVEGDKPGKCIALRADIDALPLQEKNNVTYKSQNLGVMHACGHDGHIAILLGVARLSYLLRKELRGSIRFIFQPSEEASSSGAEAMIAEGALTGVDRVAGLHLWQSLPSGHVGYNPGPMMASCDKFEIEIAGKGGHGGSSHLAVDPIVCAAALVGNLQAIISRQISPLEPAVLSIGKILGGTASNIIPENTILEGTIRTFSDNTRKDIKTRLLRTTQNTAAAFGCNSKTRIIPGYPATVNEPIFADYFSRITKELIGDDKVYAIEPTMGSDDMAYFLQKVPGIYFFLGVGNPDKNCIYPHHHPQFDIDEDVLSSGVLILANLALRYLLS